MEKGNDTAVGRERWATDDPNSLCPDLADASLDDTDTKSKHQVVRSGRDEDITENCETLRRKLTRPGPRVRVKGKAGETLPECDSTPL